MASCGSAWTIWVDPGPESRARCSRRPWPSGPKSPSIAPKAWRQRRRWPWRRRRPPWDGAGCREAKRCPPRRSWDRRGSRGSLCWGSSPFGLAKMAGYRVSRPITCTPSPCGSSRSCLETQRTLRWLSPMAVSQRQVARRALGASHAIHAVSGGASRLFSSPKTYPKHRLNLTESKKAHVDISIDT